MSTNSIMSLSGLFKEAYPDTYTSIRTTPEFKTNLEKEHWELEHMGYRGNKYEFRYGYFGGILQPRHGYTLTVPISGMYTAINSTSASLTVTNVCTKTGTVTLKSNP